MNENELMVAGANLPSATGQMPVAVLKEQVQIIQQLLDGVMKKGVHYDAIPGTGKYENGKYIEGKPVLLKAGVEKINMVCRIGSDPEIDRESDGFDTHFHIKARMFDIRTGNTLGYGVGEGSTNESKWAWRKAVCHEEYEATLETHRRIHWQKKYKKNFKDPDEFESVEQVRQNPADIINTVLKMAVKRAEVDGCRKVTACSDVFDQDLDESHIREAVGVEQPTQPQFKQPQAKTATPPANAENNAGNAPASENVISEAQRKRLFAIGSQRGLSKEEMRFVCYDVAGVEHSTEITRDKYEATVAAIEKATPGDILPN